MTDAGGGWMREARRCSYVIARNIEERFAIFGASVALVFALLTWLLLAALLQGAREPGRR